MDFDLGHPTAEWAQLHDRFYRKSEVYSMAWRVNYQTVIVRGAPFGGPIATIRDDTKILEFGRETSNTLDIYNAAGIRISSTKWKRYGFVEMGWTGDERVVVVLRDGSVILHMIDGEFSREISLWATSGKQTAMPDFIEAENYIDMACVWRNGCVVLTNEMELSFIDNWDKPIWRKLKKPVLEERPLCMTIFDPEYASTLEVLLGIDTEEGEGTILHIDAREVVDKELQCAPFTKLSVSPGGKHIACFAIDGMLHVFNSEFQQLVGFDTESTRTPNELVWVGNDSVMMWWETNDADAEPVNDRLCLMVGPNKQWILYKYQEQIHLVPEIDGVRIITPSKSEFVQKVPNVLEDIFKIGSTKPAAILYDASQHFQKGNPKSDDLIRSLTGKVDNSTLQEATSSCLAGATYLFDRYQRELLKAASFGKVFLDFYNSEQFVNVSKVLRILNSVRTWNVGIALTYRQYELLGPQALIDRLIYRRKYLLALRLCDFLGVHSDRVRLHWACQRVKQSSNTDSVDEHVILDEIVDKVADCSAISYTPIAEVAFQERRHKLAVMLLDLEKSPDAHLISLLIEMEEYDLALQKAVESNDSDLILLAINKIHSSISPNAFFKLICEFPAIKHLFVTEFYPRDAPLVDRYLEETNSQEDMTLHYYEEALKVGEEKTGDKQKDEELLEKQLGLINVAVKMRPQAKDFLRDALKDHSKLLQEQRTLDRESGALFLGLSLAETIHKLIKDGPASWPKAKSLKSSHSMSDKLFWSIKINALSERENWQQLEEFSREKKSPIGYEPFAEACIKHRSYKEAAKYIARVNSPNSKIPLLMSIGMKKEAAQLALQSGNEHLISTDSEARGYLDSLQDQSAK